MLIIQSVQNIILINVHYFSLKATELRPNNIHFWNYLKNAQIASDDDRGAEESDEIISYLKSFED